jgi:hypothetical protein
MEKSGSGINTHGSTTLNMKKVQNSSLGFLKSVQAHNEQLFGISRIKRMLFVEQAEQIDSQTEIPDTGVFKSGFCVDPDSEKRSGSRKSWVLAPRKAGSFPWSLVLRPSLREEKILFLSALAPRSSKCE